MIFPYNLSYLSLSSSIYFTLAKNVDVKVVLSISRQQKWNSRLQFSKTYIFPNIQLKGVVNRLPQFKNLSGHTNMFLMG